MSIDWKKDGSPTRRSLRRFAGTDGDAARNLPRLSDDELDRVWRGQFHHVRWADRHAAEPRSPYDRARLEERNLLDRPILSRIEREYVRRGRALPPEPSERALTSAR